MSSALPEFVAPMLATLGKEPFDSDDFVFEIKWDGIRGLAFVEGGDYRLRGRSRSDLKPRYPELAFLADLPSGLVLDGEIVALKDGRPDFYHGMKRIRSGGDDARMRALAAEVPVSFVAFDVLFVDGEDVMDAPLRERLELLRAVTGDCDDGRLMLSDGFVGAGTTLYEEARRLELEGVMAKRLDSRYFPGERSTDWVKLKPRRTVPCLVLGYVAEGRDLRSLVIGAEFDGELVCVGRVGSGLTEAHRIRIFEEARELERDDPLIDCGESGKDATWLDPGLFCTVSYLERTATGLRAPVFVDLISSPA